MKKLQAYFYCLLLMVSISVDLVRASELSIPKGIIQIVADATGYDQDKNTFVCTGNAIAIIGGQDSRLEADSILYDQGRDIIDARGNVRISRLGQLTTGSSFRFKSCSDEYLVTDPGVKVDGVQINLRTANGVNEGAIVKRHTVPPVATTQIPVVSGLIGCFRQGASQDNQALVTSNPDLAKLYGTAIRTKEIQHPVFCLEGLSPASTANQFALDNDLYGIKSYLSGSVGPGVYSIDNYRAIAQIHPQFAVSLNRFKAGDLKGTKWLRFGGGHGYDLSAKAAYSKTLGDFPRRAIGFREGRPVAEGPHFKFHPAGYSVSAKEVEWAY